MTNGHVDIFERASKLVDKLIVAVLTNPNKNNLFTQDERVELIKASVAIYLMLKWIVHQVC